MPKNVQINIHADLEETFSFFKKMEILPIQSGLSQYEKNILTFRNTLVQNKKYIYPIYKMYYENYKEAVKGLSFLSRENIFDFLCVITEKDKKGSLYYLEKLYKEMKITPLTFTTLYDLLVDLNPDAGQRILNFLKEKRETEIKDFHVLSDFISEKNIKGKQGKEDFLICEEKEIQNILDKANFQKGNYYIQVLNKKAVDDKIREELFHILYQFQIPFSPLELQFFLVASKMDSQKLDDILKSFGITKETFNQVFTMSVCINPHLKDIYETYSKKENSKASIYPSKESISEMNEKLIQNKDNKKKVYL